MGFHYRYDKEHDQYIHPAGLMIVTPGGTISRYFYGIAYDPGDLRLSLVEASDSRIGSLADQILLFCYHYDATIGKYTLAVFNAVRIGGVLTLVALGAFIAVMFRRERKQRKPELPPPFPSPREGKGLG